MTAKQQAIKDIREELKELNKMFIAYHKELNAPIKEIVKEQLKEQRKISKISWCLNAYSFPIKKETTIIIVEDND